MDYTPQAGGGIREDTVMYFEGGEKPMEGWMNIENADGSSTHEIVEYDLKGNVTAHRMWGYKGYSRKNVSQVHFSLNQWKEVSYL